MNAHDVQMHVLVAPPFFPLPSLRLCRLSHPDHFNDTMSQDEADPSTSTSSPNFDTIFTAALNKYKKRTKKDIAAHSLAAQIESCDSPNAVLAVLQTQVETFDPSPSANEKWTSLLGPTITVLYAFSGFLSKVAKPVNRETSNHLRPTSDLRNHRYSHPHQRFSPESELYSK